MRGHCRRAGDQENSTTGPNTALQHDRQRKTGHYTNIHDPETEWPTENGELHEEIQQFEVGEARDRKLNSELIPIPGFPAYFAVSRD